MGRTFFKDLHRSQEREAAFQDWLGWYGIQTENTSELQHFPAYDIIAYSKQTQGTKTYEVKYDERSHRTGNVAVELYKTKNGSDFVSGLSATQADYWTYSFPGDSSFYVITTDKLLNILCHSKVVRGGDNGSTVLALLPKDFFLNNCDKI